MVQLVDWIRKPGLYAPLTPSGTLIVNNLVVSCYVSFSPEPETIDNFISHHFFAHLGLSLLRSACSTVSPAWCETYDEGGTLKFVQLGASCFSYASRLPSMLRSLLLYCYIAVLIPFHAAECFLGSKAVGYLFLFSIILWWNHQRAGSKDTK